MFESLCPENKIAGLFFLFQTSPIAHEVISNKSGTRRQEIFMVVSKFCNGLKQVLFH